MRPPSKLSAGSRAGLRLGLNLGLCLSLTIAAGCGQEDPNGDFTVPEGVMPFGGRTIKFQSSYLYFPSDFSMALVRDTMPQEDACRIFNMYAKSKPAFPGLPVLPYEQEHYALIINIDSVHNPDEVSLDPTDHGGVADMRWAVLGQYPVGKNIAPLVHWPASGVIRISDLQHYQSAKGDFKLQFPSGERTEQTFDVKSCP